MSISRFEDEDDDDNQNIIPYGTYLRYVHVIYDYKSQEWAFQHQQRAEPSQPVQLEQLGTFKDIKFAGLMQACENLAVPDDDEDCQDWTEKALEAIRGMVDEGPHWDKTIEEQREAEGYSWYGL